MSETGRIADDYRSGIKQVVVEIYGKDTPEYRRRVYREFEKPEKYRLKGIFKTGEREVSCVPSIVRADLARRAEAASLTAQNSAPLRRIEDREYAALGRQNDPSDRKPEAQRDPLALPAAPRRGPRSVEPGTTPRSETVSGRTTALTGARVREAHSTTS